VVPRRDWRRTEFAEDYEKREFALTGRSLIRHINRAYGSRARSPTSSSAGATYGSSNFAMPCQARLHPWYQGRSSLKTRI